MASQVQIISKEMVKPSSPTPLHLRNLKLSLLDQITPPIYNTAILLYPHHALDPDNRSEISRLLKQSLSNTLTIFYPLAGRIHENYTSVDCNDFGVEFMEARVQTRLLEVKKEANVEELQKLQPLDAVSADDKVILAVRISFFDCGGISVAICMNHKIGDASSILVFMHAWAATCRGETINFKPIFDFASIFPPRYLPELGSTQNMGVMKEKLVTKRFIFNKEKLAQLKEHFAAGGSKVRDPTRVEVVSAYLWRRFIDVAKAKKDTKIRSFAAFQSVNLRPRARPPLSVNAFGNGCIDVFAQFKSEDNSTDLVSILRDAVRSVDNDNMIKKVQTGEYLNYLSRLNELFSMSDVQLCGFSCCSRFPFYDLDFGWGKPVWTCPSTAPFKNFVTLVGSPCGEEIEAWVSLLEDEMEMFEEDQTITCGVRTLRSGDVFVPKCAL